MSKKLLFILAIGATFMTAKKCFVAGKEYTEEELGEFKDCRDDFDKPYFVEGTVEVPVNEPHGSDLYDETGETGEIDTAAPKAGTKVTIGRKKAEGDSAGVVTV